MGRSDDTAQRHAQRHVELMETINAYVRSGDAGSWLAAAWLLARRWPEKYGPRDFKEAIEDADLIAGDEPWQCAARELSSLVPAFATRFRNDQAC